MKRLLLIGILWVFSISLFSQNAVIESFTLKNGMKVMLCEDHQQPSIYGAVLVHAGSKNDPADNTGMAHYLEHLMFKGTDRIGTTDWKAEKPILDEIDNLYDALHGETNEAARQEILKKINLASAKAAQYAIPNEVDVILSKMGGTGVNAFTSNDVTCYHNQFPSNQLEKWLTVYAERFRRPVFRLFQSELEAVYEEFNMYADQPMSVFFEDAIAAAYGKHPYGRPVIGYQEHLKNPQTTAMERFFNTYYHPKNMTLILVGDFNAQSIKPLLEKTMGAYRNDYAQEFRQEKKNLKPTMHAVPANADKVEPFNGVKTITVSQTPINMGVVEFQTIGSNRPDAFYLDILSGILNNEAETGILDNLVRENKIMEASAFNYSMVEEGIYAIFYAPKMNGQSFDDAEKLIMEAIKKLHTGDFSDELFEAVKMEYLRDYIESMESLEGKFSTLLDLATNGFDSKIFVERENLIRSLTKDDLVAVSQKFIGDNYLIFRSKVGQKEVKRLEKPSWEPITTKNAELTSDFAKKIEGMPVTDIVPQQLNFHEAVRELEINKSCHLYYADNPYNDIFTIQMIYKCGELTNPLLPTAVEYFSYQGTDKFDGERFQLELQKLGANMSVTTTPRETYITISGFDNTLHEVLDLCRQKFEHPGNEEKYLTNIVEQRMQEAQMNRSDADTWGRALYYYALYGKQSPYLTRPSTKQIAKLKGSKLLDVFSSIRQYESVVTYVGSKPEDEVMQLLLETFKFEENVKRAEMKVREQVRHQEPQVLLADNKKFMQSNIYFLINGEQIPLNMIPYKELYNEYMGGSMAGVIFQDIRELRSLGYSAFGTYVYDPRTKEPGFMMGYLGTQADKTLDGLEAMSDLLLNFPKRSEKFEMAKTSIIHQAESDYVTFRQIPDQIRVWQEMGYVSDPRVKKLDQYKNATLEDIQKFHQVNMAGRPIVITIAGDSRRFDTKALKKAGTVVKVKYQDIITD